MPRTITTSEEDFLTAPANLTSLWNDPFGPVHYRAPIPAGNLGIGAVQAVGGAVGGATSGIMTGLLAAGPLGVPAAAVLGAVVGASSIFSSLLQPSLAGMQKQDATTLVNGIEPILKQNLSAFLANPTPANQQAAMQVFMAYWNQLVSGCSQFAGAGTACVNDRSPGGKWDWWAYYYYPIANYGFGSSASTVSGGATPQSSSVATVSYSSPMGGGVDMTWVLILGAVGLLIWKMRG